MTDQLPAAAAVLEIRPYRDADREAVIALWRASLEIPPHNDPERDIAFCRGSGHGEVFVGTQAEAVVASIMAGHDGHRGWVYYLAAAHTHRRRGFARQMMRHAEAWLAAQGVPKVNLLIRQNNAGVQAFYERLGYVVEPRISMGRPLAPVRQQLEMVITYMEMTAPPATLPPPAPAGKLAVLRAEAITVPFYRFLYDSVGSAWMWYERRQLSDAALAAIIGDPRVEIAVLYVGGQPAGYGELDKREAPEIELAYFGLMPGFIGRGLGRFFLRALVDNAWVANPARLWLHSCNFDHPSAFAHYQRAGFVPYRQETTLIEDPRPLR